MRQTAQALVLTSAAFASVWIFVAVDAGSHSVNDTFYGSVVPIGLVWLAALAVLVMLRRTIRSP